MARCINPGYGPLFVLFLLWVPLFSAGQSQQFIIDGKVNDWQNIPAKEYGEPSDVSGPIDLESMAVTHDRNYLYIKLQLNKSLQMVGPNEYDARFYLYLDTDNNPSTGYSVGSIGAELGFNLTGQTAYRNVVPEKQTTLDQAGIRVLPTVTGHTYELAISLNDPENRASLFESDSVELLFHEQSSGDFLPDTNRLFHYSLHQKGMPVPAPIAMTKESPDHLRLMSYNVLNNGLTEPNQKPHIQALIKTINPDFITLNECWDITPGRARDFMDRAIPEKDWHSVKLDEGNITLSRYPVKDQWQILTDARLTGALIDLPDHRFPKDLFLVNAHLPCCEKDEERQQQSDALMDFIQKAKEPDGKPDLPHKTPIVVAGDMNLVGKAQTLTTLLSGQIVNTGTFGKGQKPDWDGTNLWSATGRHTHSRMIYTWLNPDGKWPAGKLDYIFYSNSVMKEEKSYTLNTQGIPVHALRQLGLEKQTASRASDHFPVVADFSLKAAASKTVQEPFEQFPLKIYDEIGTNNIHLISPRGSSKPDVLFLFASNGEKVLEKAINADPEERFVLHAENLPIGVFWLRYDKGNVTKVRKLFNLD